MSGKLTCSATILWLVCAALSSAEQPGENLALGKKYRLKPRPNYSYCTESGDRVQLTDGVYTEGYFWTQKSTVGWTRANPAVITLDLGAVQPICGLSYNTAGGRAGVCWPERISILVSDDGKTYQLAGDLVELATEHGLPEPEKYRVCRYWTDKLATYGRYVTLMIVVKGPYTFVDEIEVYRGKDELLQQPRSGRTVGDLKQFFTEIEITKAVRRRLNQDLAAVRQAATRADLSLPLIAELARVEKAIPKLVIDASRELTTVFPMNELHKRTFAVQSALWRKSFAQRVVAWQKNRWDMLSPTEPPQPGGAKIEVHMMRNEFRSAAFNLSNTVDSPCEVRMRVAGLPGGPNPPCLSVHEAPFTDTKSGVPIAAALPYATHDGTGYCFGIESGMTRQVWLTFDSADVPAGEYQGMLTIEPGDIQIPLKLKVYPLTFPQQPTLHLGGWDYTNNDRMYDVTVENRDAFIKHLREHFVDTPWATSNAMSRGKYDPAGNMTEPPSPENFEKWISRWPGARNYYVFAALRDRFAGFDVGTPECDRAVANWINWWVDKLKGWGIRPSQLGLLLVDETHSHKQDDVIIAYAKAIRQAQPEVVIWEDPTWREPWNARPELFESCDVLCPNLPMWIDKGQAFANFYVRQRKAGRELWFYSCSGPGKLLDPYSYHRMQHWFCWKYDAKGSCFWAFGDSNRSSSWNEYLSQRGAYTPMFLDAISVTPGKHMEAIREGMEDYEYLRMLRDRIVEVEKAGRADKDAIAAAKELLSAAADRVTACMTVRDKINWQEPKDRSVADAVRVEVLEMLAKLGGK